MLDRPYRLSVRVSEDEIAKISKIREQLGYTEHNALFLVKLALDLYDNEVADHHDQTSART